MYRITESGTTIPGGLMPLQIAAQSFEGSNSSGVSAVLFISVVLLLILLIITFLAVLYMQRKVLKEKLAKQQVERQQKEVAFQKMIADTALSSLRAQMNPHFIFNCLNSIKLYTSENNSQAASDYLSKFARLMRLVLENSRTDFVPLAIELETLELYIELEAMRFKDKLQYRILLDPGVDTELLQVPPLLIQPYVENAIWHGLMQKEEGGLVSIQFIADHPGFFAADHCRR